MNNTAIAIFWSTCATCPDDIKPGDDIHVIDQGVICTKCGAAPGGDK